VGPHDLSANEATTQGLETALAYALRGAGDVVIITDATSAICYVNPAFERVTGYSAAEVLGKNPRILKSGKQEAAVYDAMWQALRAGESWRGRFQNRRKDGTEYTADVTLTPIVDVNGITTHFAATQHDVTEVLRLTQELLQAQKAEVLATVVGGVMHDLNNLLAVVRSNGESLARERPDDDGQLADILTAADRAAVLVRSMLLFVRGGETLKTRVDLGVLAVDLSPLIRRVTGPGCDVRFDFPPAGGALVQGVAIHLEQVLLNLVINARQAMGERGGRLKMSISVNDVEVTIVVEDGGPGIPEPLRAKVFEPFFTTKATGSGIGLSSVVRIIKGAGGTIEVEQADPTGALFRITLPKAA